MTETLPGMRRDLEFIPIQYGGEQLILVRDHLGLVQEGKAIPTPTYQLLTLLDGARSLVDLQSFLMRHGGGVLVESETIRAFISRLDESFLLDSKKFSEARVEIVARFGREKVRPCSHAGSAYPANPDELGRKLDGILSLAPLETRPRHLGTKAIVSPHIDLDAGKRGYANAYSLLKTASPSRVVVLGIGHRLGDSLFSVTEKDFQTPFGVVRSDKDFVRRLRSKASAVISPDDFVHRSEHSIEFQLLFLQHVLRENSLSIVPVLCGSIQSCVPEYRRSAYLEMAGSFLDELRSTLAEDEGTLLIAGVDLSHIGLKFGHNTAASNLESAAGAHDRRLLECLCRMDAEGFWEESAGVSDRYNVCGFSALACLLEVIPLCKGEILSYDCWHEEATQSAVSFASMAFRN